MSQKRIYIFFGLWVGCNCAPKIIKSVITPKIKVKMKANVANYSIIGSLRPTICLSGNPLEKNDAGRQNSSFSKELLI